MDMFISLSVSACIHLCLYLSSWLDIYLYACIKVHVQYMYRHIHMSVHVRMCICTYKYLYVHALHTYVCSVCRYTCKSMYVQIQDKSSGPRNIATRARLSGLLYKLLCLLIRLGPGPKRSEFPTGNPCFRTSYSHVCT